MSERIQLLGRIVVRAEVLAKSGLSIGGGEGGPGPGLVDQPVARDLLSGEPYIPGSSLKGKMRALTERAMGASLVQVGGGADRREARSIHRCATEEEYRSRGGLEGYRGCPICHLYGAIPDRFPVLPTRLVTRDAPLTEASRLALSRRRTELPFTELKGESLVDRLTAAATPRQRERVPAGAVFDARWDLSCYAVDGADLHDEKLLGLFLAGLSLLAGDYLGGQGSRGYGRVEVRGLTAAASHDGGLCPEARALLEKLAAPADLAAALEAAGNPLQAEG